jgi:hypothetical protein
MGRACSTCEVKECLFGIWVGKTTRWEDNIKMDHRETGWGCMNCCECGNERSGSIKYQEILK